MQRQPSRSINSDSNEKILIFFRISWQQKGSKAKNASASGKVPLKADPSLAQY
ncbi:Hypothetical protein P9303_16441 [Prochlorococcus marinus str. MIT 9303]|uniref:Uncharacterized protein n=1 Tax=Prochlorococcus marinus (strain MIT 9303) TaxID=59922 RepID=A2CA78_PROM3|nr:Hypothetical protein P9303_16441 [Prochlorococcus marinus str. MIT 9303]